MRDPRAAAAPDLVGRRFWAEGPNRLWVADGHLGIWGAVRNIWPEAAEQRCWNHKILNVLDQLPKTQHRAARQMLRGVSYAPSRKEAERQRKQFEAWCERRGYRQGASRRPAGC